MKHSGLGYALSRLFLVVLVVLGAGLLFLDGSDDPRVESARRSAEDKMSPIMETVTAPIRFVRDLFVDFRRFIDIYGENERLRAEIQQLNGWRETADQLEAENATLKALNNVELSPQRRFVTAEVIGDSGNQFIQTALLSVGKDNGVLPGSAVLDAKGLVGRVIGSGKASARVLMLTDAESHIPVTVQPGNVRALLSGDNTSRPLLTFAGNRDEIRPGAAIVTSGSGGILPAKLFVGVVDSVSDRTIRVSVAAEYGRLEFVRVLLYRDSADLTDNVPVINGSAVRENDG